MTQLESTLRRAIVDLQAAHLGYALIGGLAVSVRTEPRFTRDADLAVAVASDAEAEALVHRLQTVGYRIESLVEQDAVGRLAAARVTRSRESQSPVVDLLFASSGIEQEVVRDADPINVLAGLEVPVARTGDLVALKVLSRDDVRRPQDIIDLRALIAVCSEADVKRARQSAALIAERGFHRGRDVVAELERLLHDGSLA